MKNLLFIFLWLFYNLQVLPQDKYYTSLSNVVDHLASDLSTKIENPTSSRVVIGKITMRENVNPDIGEEFNKSVLKSNEIHNSFTIISNQYTRFISRKTSDSEIINIAKNVKADYIMRGQIKRIDDASVEIFLSLIDMKSMGEVGVSAIYNYDLSGEVSDIRNVNDNSITTSNSVNGLIGSYNFIEPQNKNFAAKFEKQISFDAGLIFTLYDSPTDFLGFRSLMELQFSYIYGDFTNNISFVNLQPEGGNIYVEREQFKEFHVYSGLIGFNINPKLTDHFSLIGGVSLTYGAMVFNVYKLDQKTVYNPNQRYDQNTPEDKRVISFFSPGYSGGILLRLSSKSPIILFARYYNSFYSKDSEWHGVKVGIILAFPNRQKGFVK